MPTTRYLYRRAIQRVQSHIDSLPWNIEPIAHHSVDSNSEEIVTIQFGRFIRIKINIKHDMLRWPPTAPEHQE